MLVNELKEVVKQNKKFGDLELCLKWHRRLWDFLSTVENPYGLNGRDLKFATFFDDKRVHQDLLKEFELTEEQFKVFYVLGCGCFCCLYAKHKYLQTTDSFSGVVNFKCKYCPLSWGDNKKDTCFSIDEDDEEDGLYENWSYMIEYQQYDKAYELALKIRDLPLRN